MKVIIKKYSNKKNWYAKMIDQVFDVEDIISEKACNNDEIDYVYMLTDESGRGIGVDNCEIIVDKLEDLSLYKDFISVDGKVEAELNSAGIQMLKLPEFMRERSTNDLPCIIGGTYFMWSFERFPTYWAAEGPGIPFQYANELFKNHGASVRVDGNKKMISPSDKYKGLSIGYYHIDSLDGLKALMATLNKIKGDHALEIS